MVLYAKANRRLLEVFGGCQAVSIIDGTTMKPKATRLCQSILSCRSAVVVRGREDLKGFLVLLYLEW